MKDKLPSSDIPHTYRSIAKPSEGFYKEKGSKFLAFAYPVSSEEAIKNHLHDLKKAYHDARHYCYAYLLFEPPAQYRAYDDGEPANSAGQPILRQIRSAELHNVLIVVVRYFGGTKLGVSGLIQAYGTAAAQALANAQTITHERKTKKTMRFPYPMIQQAMLLIQEHEARILEEGFDGEQAKYRLEIALKHLASFEQKTSQHYQILLEPKTDE